MKMLFLFSFMADCSDVFKAVVADKAQAAFSGVIKIKEDAQKIQAFQLASRCNTVPNETSDYDPNFGK